MEAFGFGGLTWLSQGRASLECGHGPCHHDKTCPDSPRAARQIPGAMLGAFMAAVEYSGSKILWVLWASPLCRGHTLCPQAWSRNWWDDLACPESPCTPHLIALPGCSIPEIGCARHQRGHSGLMWLFPFLCLFPWLTRQPQLKLPWYNASGLLFF